MNWMQQAANVYGLFPQLLITFICYKFTVFNLELCGPFSRLILFFPLWLNLLFYLSSIIFLPFSYCCYLFSVLFPFRSAAAASLPIILQVCISYNRSFRSCPYQVRNCLRWKGAFSDCFRKSVNSKSLKRSLFCLCNLSLWIVFLAATSVLFLMKWWKTSDVFTENSVLPCKCWRENLYERKESETEKIFFNFSAAFSQ